MKSFYNLLEEPWIPCIRLDGRMEPLSLRDTLAQAHTIREIYTDSPLTVAALHRLLLAVLHRVFGPKDRHVWADLWHSRQKRWEEKIDEYLSRPDIHSRFYLFDEQYPFYQVAHFPSGVKPEPQPISQLALEVASGNNLTLFEHHSDLAPESVTLDEAARRLVTAQAFTIGFGISYVYNGAKVMFLDGPCARGALFFVQGDNLFQTLLLSMRQYPHSSVQFTDDEDKDKPCWEMNDPLVPARKAPFGYLDYLTWQSLQIRLVPPSIMGMDARITHVCRIQGLGLDKAAVLDPLKSYRLDDSGNPISRGFSDKRALWRDSVALFELINSSRKGASTPENLQMLAQLVRHKVLPCEAQYRYLAIGLATEEGHARNVALWRYERMPLPLAYLADETAVGRLRDALNLAQAVDWRLGDACDWLTWLWLKPDAYERFDKWAESRDYKNRGKNTSFTTLRDQLSATQHYWWRLAQPFESVLTGLAAEDEAQVNAAMLAWRDTLRQAATAAFQEITEGIEPSPRTLRAIVKAEAHLDWGLGIALKT